MRRKLFSIIEPSNNGDKLSYTYDILMMATIVISIVPLAFKESNVLFRWIDYITVGIFIIDYLFRLITADYKLKRSAFSFMKKYKNADKKVKKYH